MPSRLATLLLLSLFAFTSFAAEPSIRPFSAVYALYKGGIKVGKAKLSMEQSVSSMRWQLSSKASGVYALLTSKEPYSESILQGSAGDYRLDSIQVLDNREDQPIESAQFDWQKNKLNIQRKGKSKTLRLGNSVFDYLSVHWLSAQMTISAGTKNNFDFYRKGKLVRSTLKLVGEPEISIKDESRSVRLYEQSFKKSKTKYQFYYDLKNPLLPIKIERTKPGKDSSIMLFERFE